MLQKHVSSERSKQQFHDRERERTVSVSVCVCVTHHPWHCTLSVSFIESINSLYSIGFRHVVFINVCKQT